MLWISSLSLLWGCSYLSQVYGIRHRKFTIGSPWSGTLQSSGTGRVERGSFTLTLSQNRAWKSPLTRLFTLYALCICFFPHIRMPQCHRQVIALLIARTVRHWLLTWLESGLTQRFRLQQLAEGLMPVPAHRHWETFSHLIGSYGYILYGR